MSSQSVIYWDGDEKRELNVDCSKEVLIITDLQLTLKLAVASAKYLWRPEQVVLSFLPAQSAG